MDCSSVFVSILSRFFKEVTAFSSQWCVPSLKLFHCCGIFWQRLQPAWCLKYLRYRSWRVPTCLFLTYPRIRGICKKKRNKNATVPQVCMACGCYFHSSVFPKMQGCPIFLLSSTWAYFWQSNRKTFTLFLIRKFPGSHMNVETGWWVQGVWDHHCPETVSYWIVLAVLSNCTVIREDRG